MSARPPPRLDLDIGELHLPGWEAHERDRLVAAFHRELERLAVERGLPARLASGGAMLDLDHLRFDAAPGAGPEEAGIGAAGRVMRSLEDAR